MSKIWIGVICFIGVITLYFSSKAGQELWGYFSLHREAQAQVTEWEIIPSGYSKYAIKAHYLFHVKGAACEGETTFRKSDFLNEYSAQKSLPKWQEKQWHVWYNEKNPSNCSLQKFFPFKSVIRAFLSLAVFFYFFVVRFFVARRMEAFE